MLYSRPNSERWRIMRLAESAVRFLRELTTGEGCKTLIDLEQGSPRP